MARKKPTDHFVLQDFLPYLANRAGVKTGLTFSKDLEEFGLTLFEWRILIALWDNENLRLNDVADIIVADLSTVSRQVKAMELAGLVACARSRTDRRALSLVLTAKGAKVTARIIPLARLHERVAIQGLEDAELAALRRGLVKIFENLSAFEAGRTPGALSGAGDRSDG